MLNPSVLPDWPSDLNLFQNLKDFKSRVKIHKKLKQWILMIEHSISKIRNVLDPSMILDWSFRVYFDQILKDFKSRTKIHRNMIWRNLLIKHFISGFWTIPIAFMTPDWLFDACTMRFGGPPLMMNKIIIFNIDVTKLGAIIKNNNEIEKKDRNMRKEGPTKILGKKWGFRVSNYERMGMA